LSWKVVEYKTYVWLPYYFLNHEANEVGKIKGGHVMFLLVDHHEPGFGEKGRRKSELWSKRFQSVVDGIQDDYGNPVQYSWFYPYDHKNPAVLSYLNELVYKGLGEIEFHWHHGPHSNKTFAADLAEAIQWFNSFGIMRSADPAAKVAFGFVHGNWALDNSEDEEHSDWCGVNRELDILEKYGCYADFTFPTLGFVAQPKQVNSIYYATDDDGPKSYNTGSAVRVGGRPPGLMIFQGPIGNDWHDLNWDCAAIEKDGEFRPHRAALWLRNAPSVKSKEDWLFVKVNTHGLQSRDVILSENFRELYLEMKEICKKNGLSLHFVTARQAYNIVKAAEAGMNGDPELYKDYAIKPPVNKFVFIENPLNKIVVTDSLIELKPLHKDYMNNYEFNKGPILSVSGIFDDYRCQLEDNGNWHLNVKASAVKLVTKNTVKIDEKAVLYKKRGDGAHVYSFNASTPVDVYLK
jgi:hypothetical protein